MDPNYRASEDHWRLIENWPGLGEYPGASCLLELRARIEALEAAQHTHIQSAQEVAVQNHLAAAYRAMESCLAQREEILTAFAAKYGFQPEEAIQVEQRQLDGSSHWWVERRSEPAPATKESSATAPPAPAGGLVERVADVIYRNGPWRDRHEDARAAIREVASWLRSDGPDWPSVASLLEQEANR